MHIRRISALVLAEFWPYLAAVTQMLASCPFSAAVSGWLAYDRSQTAIRNCALLGFDGVVGARFDELLVEVDDGVLLVEAVLVVVVERAVAVERVVVVVVVVEPTAGVELEVVLEVVVDVTVLEVDRVWFASAVELSETDETGPPLPQLARIGPARRRATSRQEELRVKWFMRRLALSAHAAGRAVGSPGFRPVIDHRLTTTSQDCVSPGWL